MTAVLLDTHAWAWTLTGDPALSPAAIAAIRAADAVHVSTISFYEIGQEVRLGTWPAMAANAGDLPSLLRRQGGHEAPIDGETAGAAAMLDWPHRDPFDRIIAAAALVLRLPLISADPVFDDLRPAFPAFRRIW